MAGSERASSGVTGAPRIAVTRHLAGCEWLCLLPFHNGYRSGEGFNDAGLCAEMAVALRFRHSNRAAHRGPEPRQFSVTML